MTKEEFQNLNLGDIIKQYGGTQSLVVTCNSGNRVTAVRTCDISNPTEWDVISKHHFKRIKT